MASPHSITSSARSRNDSGILSPASPRAWAACRAARRPRDGVTPPTPRWSARGNLGRRSCRWQRRRIQESLRPPSRRWSRMSDRNERSARCRFQLSASTSQPARRSSTVYRPLPRDELAKTPNDQNDALTKAQRAMRRLEIREVIQVFALLALWAFLMWLGLTAIDRGDTWLLGVYVFVASSAVSGFIGWKWGER